ncbi:MAG: diguanylate cyclase [Mariprofundus sp.]|nr:diguanylate cyclase [Mariprofundus sp.]
MDNGYLEQYTCILKQYILTQDESYLLQLSDLGMQMVHQECPLAAIADIQQSTMNELSKNKQAEVIISIFSRASEVLATLLITYEIGLIQLTESKLRLEVIVKKKTAELELKNLKLEALNGKLETLSITDTLTHITNRRGFFSAYTREWKRAVREKNAISIIMADIDYFKQFNDTYGHVCGDHCLKRIAQELSNIALRPGDMAARYGGEEFILMLPNTDKEAALKVANHILTRVHTLKIEHLNSQVDSYVTISLGIATVTAPHFDLDYNQLIKSADQSLYIAKNNGRNRVHS